MNNPKVRFRLRTLLGLPLDTSERRLEFMFRDREVTIGGGNFESHVAAREFADALRRTVDLAAVCARLGVDTGQDVDGSWIDEGFARSEGLLQPHQRGRKNIHGIVTYLDDGNTRFPVVEGALTLQAPSDQLMGALSQLATRSFELSPLLATSLELMNRALLNADSHAQIVLAFAAIEALGQSETWTEKQIALLESLAAQVKAQSSDLEHTEIATALRRSLHRIGLRQGVMRVLDRLALGRLRGEWDDLYRQRSGLVHGISSFTPVEVLNLAASSIRLCGRIVLAAVGHEGIALPKITALHFEQGEA